MKYVFPYLLLLILLTLALVSCSDAAVSNSTVSDASETEPASIAVTEMISQNTDTGPSETTESAPIDTIQTEMPTETTALIVPDGKRQFGYVGSVESRDDRLSFRIHTMTAPGIQLTDQDRKDLDLVISADHTTVYAMDEQAISPDAIEIGDIIAYIPARDAQMLETYPGFLTGNLLYLEIVKKNTDPTLFDVTDYLNCYARILSVSDDSKITAFCTDGYEICTLDPPTDTAVSILTAGSVIELYFSSINTDTSPYTLEHVRRINSASPDDISASKESDAEIQYGYVRSVSGGFCVFELQPLDSPNAPINDAVPSEYVSIRPETVLTKNGVSILPTDISVGDILVYRTDLFFRSMALTEIFAYVPSAEILS